MVQQVLSADPLRDMPAELAAGGPSAPAPAAPPPAASGDCSQGDAASAALDGRDRRVGADGWPRIYHPNRCGFMRLSRNAAGAWDVRSTCRVCGSTLSRTCKAPARPTGQGRPIGKCWAWLSHAADMPHGHTPASHRRFVPDLEARRRARMDFSSLLDIEQWLCAERVADPAIDGGDGEPFALP